MKGVLLLPATIRAVKCCKAVAEVMQIMMTRKQVSAMQWKDIVGFTIIALPAIDNLAFPSCCEDVCICYRVSYQNLGRGEDGGWNRTELG
jgi:hypothetical protein